MTNKCYVGGDVLYYQTCFHEGDKSLDTKSGILYVKDVA